MKMTRYEALCCRRQDALYIVENKYRATQTRAKARRRLARAQKELQDMAARGELPYEWYAGMTPAERAQINAEIRAFLDDPKASQPTERWWL